MPRYGLDASVVVAFFLQEGLPRVDEFWLQLDGNDVLTGPRLLLAECSSVFRSQASRERITNDQALTFTSRLVALPIRTCESLNQFGLAVELANRLNRAKSYDMQYLASAQIENAELVTVDAGLRDAAVAVRHPVRFLR